MRVIERSELSDNSVAELYAIRGKIDLAPVYQRQSDLWPLQKRQLFIDSLINGFDVPKLYFHELPWQTSGKGRKYHYAIIDGKQRLQSVWSYVADEFPLADDFEYLNDNSVKLMGLRYSELARRYPDVKAQLDSAELPIVVVATADKDLIEEMFSRLNEALPLNAPEKRNALGGPLPPHIRRLANEQFFVRCMAFGNYRYRHLDLATKFLYIEHRNGFADLKKHSLDEFVREFKRKKLKRRAAFLAAGARRVVRDMAATFERQDRLLTSSGLVAVYYQLFRLVRLGELDLSLNRTFLSEFEELRSANRARARRIAENVVNPSAASLARAGVDMALYRFDEHMQSPNDPGALRYRFELLVEFLRKRQREVARNSKVG